MVRFGVSFNCLSFVLFHACLSGYLIACFGDYSMVRFFVFLFLIAFFRVI